MVKYWTECCSIRIGQFNQWVIEMFIHSTRLNDLYIADVEILDEKCNNKILRYNLSTDCFPLMQQYAKSGVVKIRTHYIFHFHCSWKLKKHKIINDKYPCNDFLRNRFHLNSSNCLFCNTQVRLKNISVIMNNVFIVYEWMRSRYKILMLQYSHVNYGFFMLTFFCNNIIILAKFYIHKCRVFKITPAFAFKKKTSSFFKSLRRINSKN